MFYYYSIVKNHIICTINPPTGQPINPSTYQPINLSTYQPINLSTYHINLHKSMTMQRNIRYKLNSGMKKNEFVKI
jgi:hypothetical protein